MRVQKSVFCLSILIFSTVAFCVSGFAIGSYTANGHSMRLFKITNTKVDTAYDLLTGSQYSGIAINTHGTHAAFWKKTRDGVDSAYSTTDWRKILTSADDAALYLLGRYQTVAKAATISGLTTTRVTQLKASLDSIGRMVGSTELWPVDQIRRRTPADWNWDIYYDVNTNTWTKTVHKTFQEFKLVLMRIDNPSKTIELVITGKDLTMYSNPGTIAWPAGDWIFFSTFGNGYRFLYKVNVLSREVRFVTLIDNQWHMIYNGIPCCVIADDFKMSSIGNKILLNHTGLLFSLDEIIAAKGVPDFDYWGTKAGMLGLGGCGQTISASGNFGGFQVGAGHNDYGTYSISWTNRALTNQVITTSTHRNRWSKDSNDPILACRIQDPLSGDPADKIIESVGVGNATGGHNYAVNSDAWLCLLSGWAPGGRWGSNGQNIILCNFKDSTTLNVSRGPRRIETSNGTVEPQCYVQPIYYVVDEAHFFVKEPLNEIIPELQADAQSNYTVPGLDDNTVLSSLTVMPQTPYGGLIPANVTQKPSFGRVDWSSVQMAPTRNGLKLTFHINEPGKIRIVNAAGKVVKSCNTTSNVAEVIFSKSEYPAGVYVAELQSTTTLQKKKFTMW